MVSDLGPSLTLAEKLGIDPGARVALVNEPEDFPRRLEPLPADVRFYDRASEPLDVIVYFSDTIANIEKRIPLLAQFLSEGAVLWMAYPDESSAVDTGVSREDIKRIGAQSGLTDHSSFSIDDTWRAVCLKSAS